MKTFFFLRFWLHVESHIWLRSPGKFTEVHVSKPVWLLQKWIKFRFTGWVCLSMKGICCRFIHIRAPRLRAGHKQERHHMAVYSANITQPQWHTTFTFTVIWILSVIMFPKLVAMVKHWSAFQITFLTAKIKYSGRSSKSHFASLDKPTPSRQS